jgi:hypothetical protein
MKLRKVLELVHFHFLPLEEGLNAFYASGISEVGLTLNEAPIFLLIIK